MASGKPGVPSKSRNPGKKTEHFFLGLRDLLGTSGFPLAILVQEFP